MKLFYLFIKFLLLCYTQTTNNKHRASNIEHRTSNIEHRLKIPLKVLISFTVLLFNFTLWSTDGFSQLPSSLPPGEDCSNPTVIYPGDTYQSDQIDMTSLNNYYVSFQAIDTSFYFEILSEGEFPSQLKLYSEDCYGEPILISDLQTDSTGLQSIELYPQDLIVGYDYMIEIVQNEQSSVTALIISYYTPSVVFNGNTQPPCADIMYNGSFEIKKHSTDNMILDQRIHYSKAYLLLNNSKNRADYYTPYADYSSTPFGIGVSPHTPPTANYSFAGLWAVNTPLDNHHDYYTGEFREWICGQLINEMEANRRYHVSMYVRLKDYPSNKTIGGSGSVPPGIKFTKNPTTANSQVDIVNMTADIQSTTIISQNLSGKNNWVKIEGEYTATGDEKYVTVANFLPNSQSFTGNGANFSYFYVDLISVEKNDMCCTDLTLPNGSDEMDLYNDLNLSDYVSYDYNSQTIIVDGLSINVEGSFTINGNIAFKNSHLNMKPSAKIEVVNGNTLTIDNSKLKVCGDSMWQGIEVINSTAEVIVKNNSEIWDAKKGVLSTNGGKFTITNSTFNGNEYGVYVDTYIGNKHYGTISGTTFKADHFMLKSSVSKNAFAGIYLNRVANYGVADEIIIGDVSSSKNIFIGAGFGHNASGMRYGIYSNVSSFDVVNSTFKQFGNFTAINEPERAGIKAKGGVNTINSNPPIQFAPTMNVGYASLNASEQNKFINTTKAISVEGGYTQGNKNINIINNTIEFNNNIYYDYITDYAIDVQNLFASNNEQMECNIKNNIITDMVNGIRLENSRDVDFELIDNDIALMNKAGNTGIYINHMSEANVYRIHENNISKATRGIETYGNMPYISYNTISINPTITGGIPNYGIYSGGVLKNSTVKMNNIYAQNITTNTEVYGIAINSTLNDGLIVQCNNIQNTGTALYFSDIQKNSNSSWVSDNSMAYNENCFVIANNTELGSIGALNNPSDNTFYYNTGYDTYADNSDGNLTTLYTRTGTHRVPVNNGGTPPIGVNSNATGPIYTCILVEIPTMKPLSQSNNTITNPIPKFATKYSSDTLRWMAKYKYYQSIQNDSIVNKSVNDFKDSVDLAALGQLLTINQQLLTDTNNRTTQLNNISTVVPQENLLKTVILQKQLAKTQTWDTLPIAAKDVLEPIAQACPYEAGPAVYEARAMIYQYTGKRYYNPCEGYSTPAKTQKRLKSVIENEENIDKIAVYPNPTEDNLTIELNLEKEETANFKVYDISGRLLLEKKLINTKNNLSLKGLSRGVYLYWIKNQNGKVLKKDKLVIQ